MICTNISALYVGMYKYFRLGQHSHFSEVYSKYEVSHLRPTRFRLNKNLNIPQSRLSICKNLLYPILSDSRNNISLNIKNVPPLNSLNIILNYCIFCLKANPPITTHDTVLFINSASDFSFILL